MITCYLVEYFPVDDRRLYGLLRPQPFAGVVPPELGLFTVDYLSAV